MTWPRPRWGSLQRSRRPAVADPGGAGGGHGIGIRIQGTSSTTPLESGPETPSTTPPSNSRNVIDYPPPLEIGPENSINYPPPSNSRNVIDYPPLEIGPENSINYPPPSNSRNVIDYPPRNRAGRKTPSTTLPLEFTVVMGDTPPGFSEHPPWTEILDKCEGPSRCRL